MEVKNDLKTIQPAIELSAWGADERDWVKNLTRAADIGCKQCILVEHIMFFRFVITLLAVIVLSVPAMAIEVVLVADPWPPFNCETDRDQEGYIVDVARAVFEAAGHEVTYKTVPWKRAIEGTRTGKYTGAIGASKTDAKSFVFPDEELAQNLLTFYVRQDSSWRFEGAASLGSVSIGVAGGYDYRQWLNEYIQIHGGNDRRVQVVSGRSPLEQNLKKLLLGRIDVVVDTEAAIRYRAKTLGILEQIKSAGYGVEPAFIYIAFSPALSESHLLAKQLSDGIVKLRRSGQLKIILDRYGLVDWK
jgi:polar amino acid transport system substrate-binding protein